MASAAQKATKKLFTRGVIPVFKDNGVTNKELIQWLKLSLYFENPAIKRGQLFVEFVPRFPELFQTGVSAFGFGLHASQIRAFSRYWRHQYIVTAILGRQTADFYSGSPVLAQHEYRHITSDDIKRALGKFVGEIEQSYPPYLLQERILAEHNGEEQQTKEPMNDDSGDGDADLGAIDNENNLPTRGDHSAAAAYRHPTLRIKQCHSIELLQVDGATIQMKCISDGLFNCRALVRDLGQTLGCQAVIDQLHLQQLGPLTADQALQKHELHLEQVEQSLATHTPACHEYMVKLREQYPDASPKYRFV